MWCFARNRVILQSNCTRKTNLVIRSFRRQSRPKQITVEVVEEPKFSDLIKPAIFTFAFGTTCLCGGAIWKYENATAREWKIQSRFTDIFRNLPSENTKKAGELRQTLNEWWNSLVEGDKVFLGIFAINAAVFVMWQVPHLRPFMMRYFVSNPSQRRCAPMLLSAFSHSSFIHFGMNMFVLMSFGPQLVHLLGKEHFLGVFLSGAVTSSLTSHAYKVITRSTIPSLGASGAILTLIGVYGTLNPNSVWNIVFLPGFNFTAENGIKGLIIFDTLGMITRWSFLDHAGHLGGLLYGIWWTKEGIKLTEPVVKWWRQNRDQIKRR